MDDNINIMEVVEEVQHQNQRRRGNYVLEPVDRTLVGTPILTRLSPISVSELMNGDFTMECDLNLKYIDLQLLRILVPNKDIGSKVSFYGAKGKGGKTMQNSTSYHRLYLCRALYDDTGKLVYIIQSKDTNQCLWDKNVEYRDNGILTIGTIFRVIAPQAIESLWNQDIPMLETDTPVIIMKKPVGGFNPIKNQSRNPGRKYALFCLQSLTASCKQNRRSSYSVFRSVL